MRRQIITGAGAAAAAFALGAAGAAAQTPPLSAATIAQAGAAPGETVATLPDVVVEAERARALRQSILARFGARETVVDRSTIDGLPGGANQPLNQVLLQTPGVVQDGFGDIHIRGEHRNLQYRLNGVALPEAIGGFGQVFQPRAFSSVSVLTGALPAQFGFRTNAVIELETRSGALDPGGSAGVYGGSRGLFQPHLTYSGVVDGWDVFATGTWIRSSMGIENPAPTRSALNDRTDQTHGLGYAARQLSDATRLAFIAGTALNDFRIPNREGVPPQFSAFGQSDFDSTTLRSRQWERTWYGVASLQHRFADNLGLQSSVFTRYTSTSYTPSTAGELILNGVASGSFRSGMAIGTQSDLVWRVHPQHTIRAGVQATGERARFRNASYTLPLDANGDPVDDPFVIDNRGGRTGWLYGVYMQDEWRITGRLTLNFGLRWDQMVQYVTAGQVSPRLNLVWRATDSTVVHAGYARTFTPPQFELVTTPALAAFENTTNAPFSLTNGLPRPERANRFDIGVSQRLFGNLTLGIDAYYKDVQDLLDFGQFGNAIIFTPFNYSRGKVYGVEFSGNWRTDRLLVYANLAISRAMGRNINSARYNFEPDELAYAASKYVRTDHDQMYTGSAGAIWNAWRGARLSASMLYGNGLRAGFANSEKLSPYATLNLGVQQDFVLPDRGVWTARFDILNITDTRYQLRDGTGIGVGAPQFGWRRGLFVGLSRAI